MVVIPSDNNDAAMRGRTAFFAPLISADPESGFCPCMTILSMFFQKTVR